jgi:hypothetical protein
MMNASLLLPTTLVLLAAACAVQIVRDVALRHYGQAVGGLLWGLIYIVATMMSARPLIALLERAV